MADTSQSGIPVSLRDDSQPQLRLQWPTGEVRPITRPFGANPEFYRMHELPGHNGIDIQVGEDDPIYACADGVVIEVGPDPEPTTVPWPRQQSIAVQSKGALPLTEGIKIRHDLPGPDGRYITLYGHLQAGSALVERDTTVRAGQQIAKIGATESATLPTVFLGLMHEGARNGDFGEYIDPTPFLVPPTESVDTSGESATPEAKGVQIGSTFAVNDRPRGDDRLRFKDYAHAFAAMLANPATKPPLTIGVYGAWGMGKSFLMRMIREALENEKPADAPEFCFVEFNAWVYSGSENLWAGLVSRIYERVEQRLGDSATRTFRLGKNRGKQARRISLRFILSVAVAVLLAILANWSQIAKLWSDLPALLNASSVLALILGVGSALVNTFNFVSKAYIERAQQFRQMAAQPDFRTKIGFMADIKSEIDFVTELLEHRARANRSAS